MDALVHALTARAIIQGISHVASWEGGSCEQVLQYGLRAVFNALDHYPVVLDYQLGVVVVVEAAPEPNRVRLQVDIAEANARRYGLLIYPRGIFHEFTGSIRHLNDVVHSGVICVENMPSRVIIYDD